MTGLERVGAVILAAGFGTRLAPLTDHTPKPLLDVGGRPVATHLVDLLRAVDGVNEVVVVVNEVHPNQWRSWAEDFTGAVVPRIVSNGVTSGAERLGAVADMRLAIAELDSVDRIIVLAGDNLIEEDLAPHVEAASTSGNAQVLCRDLGADVPPGRFGEITTDDDGVITRFREKPDDPESPLAATCTYVLPGDALTLLDDYLGHGNVDSPGSFVAWLAAHTPVCARVLRGRYFDIGNHETLTAARAAYNS